MLHCMLAIVIGGGGGVGTNKVKVRHIWLLIGRTPGICRETYEIFFVYLRRTTDHGVCSHSPDEIPWQRKTNKLVKTVTLLQVFDGSLCSIVRWEKTEVCRNIIF